MPLRLRWFGAFQILLLSSISIQMDHISDLGDLSSTSRTGIDEYIQKDIFEEERYKKQKTGSRNRNPNNQNFDNGKLSLEAKDSNHGLGEDNVLNLDLSLSCLQPDKSSSLEKLKGTWIKTKDMNDLFDLTHNESNDITRIDGTRLHDTSSGTSWLTIGHPENSHENEMRKNLKRKYGKSVEASHQIPSGNPWITLGFQDNFATDLGGLKSKQGHYDPRIPDCVSKDKQLESCPPIPPLENNVQLEAAMFKHPLGTEGLDFYSHNQMDFSKTLDPKNPNKLPASIGIHEISQGNSKKRIDNNPQKHQILVHDVKASEMMAPAKDNSQLMSHTQVYPDQKNVGKLPRLGTKNSGFELSDAINGMSQSQDGLPFELGKTIRIWFSNMRAQIVEKRYREDPDYWPGGKCYGAVTRATSEARVIATFFLICMKLLHKEQHLGIPNWENRILDEGWKFIQRLFGPWMRIDLEQLDRTNRYDHLDALQPEVLFNYLKNVVQHRIPSTFFWSIWKRWYRDSTYSNKRLLVTEDHFISQIQQLNLHKFHSGLPHKEEKFSKRIKSITGRDSHQSILQEHILEFDKFTIPYPQAKDLIDLAQHVGKFELDLLEHHEPVREWLESMMQYLLSELHRHGVKTRSSTQKISKYVKLMYHKVIPMFLGAMKLLEDPDSTMRLQQRDATISDGWRFIKVHLSHWKNIDIRNLFGFQDAQPVPENYHLKESFDLYKGIFKIDNSEQIPLKAIHRLYYLKNALPTDVFNIDIIKADHKNFKENLEQIFTNLQKGYLSKSQSGSGPQLLNLPGQN
ncbi:hypothetical protein DFH28DRAFT_932234 [Melampsora americana]|nr:hypothetical protein DFH28DRAFT_932234 [Melampsora americana]